MGLAASRIADRRVKGRRASREGILRKQATDGKFRPQWQKLSVVWARFSVPFCPPLPSLASIIAQDARAASKPK